ncbi:exoribonuclease II [Kushneria aurantia]|uniref:Exoribonuclease II n=1 Tax=Kushneria aurantia TaxID=504092 RepID=A0ABV6G2X0_9GAMM|nr:exoribonuclease II [Kushneria aurantia]
MFSNNDQLAQLKQQMRASTPRVQGVIKATDKGYGFLETDDGQSFFVPPPAMKQVLHGDRVEAVLHEENERKSVEPESLIETAMTRFIGRVRKREGKLSVIPDHPSINTGLRARTHRSIEESDLNEGDWVVARLLRHPLRENDRGFFVQIDELIAPAAHPAVPWRVTLARHALEQASPQAGSDWAMSDDGAERVDMTATPFFTIDNASTTDMDDALAVETLDDGGYRLTVAIADPTAYVQPGDAADREARQRAFTVYLPGQNVTMLPEPLADDLCSLKENADRPALVCTLDIGADGAVGDYRFQQATVRSHARLTYEQVSDYLEAREAGSEPVWQPEFERGAEQLEALAAVCGARQRWRMQNAIVFADRLDYMFRLDETGNVLDIVTEPRRIGHRMIEEAMIAANVCCADLLARHVGHGIFNVHQGVAPEKAEQAQAFLESQSVTVDPAQFGDIASWRELRQQLDAHNDAWLDARMRRFQGFSVMQTEPGPHFGMGLAAYATWTSPIRKYGDIVNHRLIKAVLRGESPTEAADSTLTEHLSERRRLNRLAERDVRDWLYVRFLGSAVEQGTVYEGEIVDIRRGGLRVRLPANGASAFVPASMLSSDRDSLAIDDREGLITIGGELRYRLGDTVKVVLIEAREETRSLVGRPA